MWAFTGGSAVGWSSFKLLYGSSSRVWHVSAALLMLRSCVIDCWIPHPHSPYSRRYLSLLLASRAKCCTAVAPCCNMYIYVIHNGKKLEKKCPLFVVSVGITCHFSTTCDLIHDPAVNHMCEFTQLCFFRFINICRNWKMPFQTDFCLTACLVCRVSRLVTVVFHFNVKES